MSLNKYMHPRNIYRTPPNFKQLAVDFPEFRKHVTQDITGKVSIDFKNVEALRALTCTLLKKDFGLDVEIPLTKMIPTVPLRLNYILWIEDLLSISDRNDSTRGIDIGTGASCIYPLLAAKSKGWSMLATDVDSDSINYGRGNVEKNNLGNLITVKKVDGSTLLSEALQDSAEEIDFCMCNPPFFASTQELNPFLKARRPDRPKPRNAFCCAVGEVVADGGEVNFISTLIEESKAFQKRIRIYTSMVGHKSSLPSLKKLLRDVCVTSFKQTEFCQGHTTRWALAWTYHDIDLRKVPEETVVAARKTKSKPPLHFVVPLADKDVAVRTVGNKIAEILDQLRMDYEITKESRNVIGYCVVAHSNTWSHQRKKRREQRRLSSVLKDPEGSVDTGSEAAEGNSSYDKNLENASEQIAQMKVHSPKSPLKRDLEEDGYYNCKKRRTDDDYQECYLKNSLVVRRMENEIVIELLFLEGVAGREGSHQVLQYFKNNLMLN